MSPRPILVLAFLTGAAVLGSCAPQTRFEWGNYEPSLYAYYKNPSDRAQYETTLTNSIAAGKRSGRVAPGLCAELGYMRMEDGDAAGARLDFEEEMQLFPESRQFLGGIIRRMAPGGTAAKAPTT